MKNLDPLSVWLLRIRAPLQPRRDNSKPRRTTESYTAADNKHFMRRINKHAKQTQDTQSSTHSMCSAEHHGLWPDATQVSMPLAPIKLKIMEKRERTSATIRVRGCQRRGQSCRSVHEVVLKVARQGPSVSAKYCRIEHTNRISRFEAKGVGDNMDMEITQHKTRRNPSTSSKRIRQRLHSEGSVSPRVSNIFDMKARNPKAVVKVLKQPDSTSAVL